LYITNYIFSFIKSILLVILFVPIIQELFSFSFGIRIFFIYILEIIPSYINYIMFILVERNNNEESGPKILIKAKNDESENIFFDE
jgi:hypothetical protein